MVLWSSFEHHLTADRVIGTAGDYFAALLEANGIAWAAVTDPGQRQHLVLQVLAQVPVLWIWDNIEPVTGFPVGTPSDWTRAEQDELMDLLRDLAQNTRCKVLLTSRRDEHNWLGDLPSRVQLPAMPMRESLQLAAALAARHGHTLDGVDWRPLLRYAVGNPLTISVLVGQALRENLTTTQAIETSSPGCERGEASSKRGRTRRWAAPGPWPPLSAMGSPRRSPTPSAPSSRCCTCSATPSTSTPCTHGRPGDRRGGCGP